MMKISDLQSQVSLNRNFLKVLEEGAEECRNLKRNLLESALTRTERFHSNNRELRSISKQIKQYAKLQRALKSELAYRIRIDRVMREVEALTEKAKVEGWEVVIVDDNKYDEMLKGD